MNYGRLISQWFFITVLIVATAWSSRSEEKKAMNNQGMSLEAPKTYTRGNLLDYTKEASENAEKGATLLVWGRNKDISNHEVEIYREDRPNSRLQFKSSTNYFHIMVFMDKTYLWRVRYLDDNGQPLSEYSLEEKIKVLRPQSVDAAPVLTAVPQSLPNVKSGPQPTETSQASDVEQVVLDLSSGQAADEIVVNQASKKKPAQVKPQALVPSKPLVPIKPAPKVNNIKPLVTTQPISKPSVPTKAESPKPPVISAPKRDAASANGGGEPEPGLFIEEASGDEADFDY